MKDSCPKDKLIDNGGRRMLDLTADRVMNEIEKRIEARQKLPSA
jgi:hypothetical protein